VFASGTLDPQWAEHANAYCKRQFFATLLFWKVVLSIKKIWQQVAHCLYVIWLKSRVHLTPFGIRQDVHFGSNHEICSNGIKMKEKMTSQ